MATIKPGNSIDGAEIKSENLDEKTEQKPATLLEIGNTIKDLMDAGNIEKARSLFDRFMDLSVPTIKKYLEKNDTRKGEGKPTRYAGFIDDAIQQAYTEVFQNFPRFIDNFNNRDSRNNGLLNLLHLISRHRYFKIISKRKRIKEYEEVGKKLENIPSADIEPGIEEFLKEVNREVLIQKVIEKILLSDDSKRKTVARIATLFYVQSKIKEEIIKELGIGARSFDTYFSLLNRFIDETIEDELGLSVRQKGHRTQRKEQSN